MMSTASHLDWQPATIGAVTLDTKPATARGHARSPAGRRGLRRRIVRISWIVILVGALGLAVRARWTEVSDQLATLDVGLLVVATGFGLAGVGLSAGIWHAMLRGIGEPLPPSASLRIFFVGQIGKYVPGAVWPAVTQAALARDHGIAPRATVAAVTLFIWVHLVTGAVLGVTVLTAAGDLRMWSLAALPLLVVLLAPPVLRWTLQRLLVLARREPLRALPDGRHMLAACAWALAMWACYGMHLQVLTAAVHQPIAPVRAVGVFAASWLIGFVLLVAPAGVGPREAAMATLLHLSAGAGLVVALVSRLILTVGDAVWAAGTGASASLVRSSARQR
jgi:uncharacterized membrane protein YbhN (UPF0104 family)